jgi:hypothetical protein
LEIKTMSDAPTGDFNPGAGTPRSLLPVNKYLMEIGHIEKTLSSGGKPRLTVRMKVDAGPEKGRQWTEDCYLTPRAKWKINSLCEAVGVKETFSTDDPATLIETFVGKKLFVTIGPDDWEKDGVMQDGRKSKGYDSIVPSKPEVRDGAKAAPAAPAAPAASDNEIPF